MSIKVNTTYLKALIKEKGLKLNWVAKEAHIDRSYLYQILTHKRNPSAEVISRLLKALGVYHVRVKSKKDL